MKATELKSESLKKEYSVVIPAADFEKEVDAKINQIAKTTKIPGFRPGKAPKEMLKQKYRASVLGEVLDETVRNATEEVIKSNKLNPVMMPNIKVTKFEDGKDIEFTLTVELMPEIKIGDLSAIKLEKLMAEVPAEEVEKALNYIAQSRRETVKVEEDRAAAKGDTVVIDFTGSIDGVEFQGGKGSNYPWNWGPIPLYRVSKISLSAKKPVIKLMSMLLSRKITMPRIWPEKLRSLRLKSKNCVQPKKLKSMMNLPNLWAKKAWIS